MPLPQRKPFPHWLKRQIVTTQAIDEVNSLLREQGLATVCDHAHCPNKWECFNKKQATFLILGSICTRTCRFCSVTQAAPQPVDPDEPQRIAHAVKRFGLQYVVITSVTRDDLADGGAGHFAAVINAVRSQCPEMRVEVLIPDFQGMVSAQSIITQARPEVVAHNIETVPRLYADLRPQADYQRSGEVLYRIKEDYPELITKSGLMLGLGERQREVLTVFDDLVRWGVDIVTLGQYLQPERGKYLVQEFIAPEEFERYKSAAHAAGIKAVVAGPFIRSSYNAEEAYLECLDKMKN